MLKKLRSFLILVLTVVLLYLVITKVGFSELISTLAGADLFWVLISVLHAPVINFTGVIKWKILLKSQNIDIPIWRLYALYMVGRFFNNFLPSNVGGDVVRAYELGAYTQDGVRAMASVFVERLTGFIVLIFVAILSLLTQLQLSSDLRLTLAVAFATAGLLVVLWLILDPRPLELLTRWVKIPLFQKYVPKLRKFHASLNAYRSHRGTLALTLFWSMIFMVLAITNVYSSARAFHQDVSLIGVATIVPVILVVAMIPLTLNGLGLQEWAYVFLFSWIGLPASVGLSTILLIRGKELLFALVGGILYPVLKLSRPRPLSGNNHELAEREELGREQVRE